MDSTTFDPENPKYKYFCGKVHLSTVTKWIYYYKLILYLLSTGYFGFTDPEFPWKLIFILFALDAFVFVSGIYAVKKEKSCWLIPYFFEFVFQTILNVFYYGLYFYYKNYDFKWIFYDIYDLATSILTTIIVYRFYQYFNAKEKSNVLPMFFTNKNSDDIMPFVFEENV